MKRIAFVVCFGILLLAAIGNRSHDPKTSPNDGKYRSALSKILTSEKAVDTKREKSDAGDTSSAETPPILVQWQLNALKAVRSEKQVVEALFTQSISLWVSVRDNGTPRNGYAEYLCLLLYDHSMPVGELVIITIFDAAKMASGSMQEIGRFECIREGS